MQLGIPPPLRPLLRILVDVDPPLPLGPTPLGERRMIVFRGGTFTGMLDETEELHGTIAPGGADWQLVRADDVLEIDARYVLRTDRDEAIEVRSTGLRAASLEVMNRLGRGDFVDPSQYYFRTHIRLSTGAPRLARLNSLLAVSAGVRRMTEVQIDVHEVL